MPRYKFSFIALLLSIMLIAGCAGSMAMHSQSNSPAELDYSTTRASDEGRFVVSFTSALDPIVINQMHSWTLHVETADGAPVENAVIQVSGGMPEHFHGMPTQPRVTQNLGGGDYLVEGMRFQMGGWWTVTFAIDANGVQDSVTFNLRLR
ncbi:MAG: FixH family protein [Caldilinea sp.]